MSQTRRGIILAHSEPPIYARPVNRVPHAAWVKPLNPEEANHEVGFVNVTDLYLPNFTVRDSFGIYAYDGVLVNTASEGLDKVGFCLFLKGSMESSVNAQPAIRSPQGTQNFKYDPQNEYVHHIKAGMEFRILHFTVRPECLMHFLPDDEPWADMLRMKLLRGERMMGEYSPYITEAQDRALQLILHCPLKGKLGEFMVETAIQQIILLQMHAIFMQAELTIQGITQRDRGLLREVREYLSSHFLDDHTLAGLSRHFGVNTNKLMMLFKRLFGQSIFEFITEKRMVYARALLRDGTHRVIDVARQLGYKNPNHFSTAYKKHFGISPSSDGFTG